MVKGSRKQNKAKLVRKPWHYVLLTIAAIFLIGIFLLFSFFSLLFSLGASSTDTGLANIALIPIEGAIMGTSSGGYFDSGVASSEALVAQIQAAEDDESVDAIVFYINSPGGSAVASDEIATAVLLTEKPTVAVIREVGASGAYWIATASDYVIANRMSITGSIGVVSSYLEFSELMEEYGVGYQRLVAGENKDIGSPFRALAVSEEELLQGKIDLIHDYFIDAVAKNRGLTRMAVASVATGEFYLGVEALGLGLVDELGDLKTAEEYLLKEKQIETLGYYEYSRGASIFDVLGSLSAIHGFSMGSSLGEKVASGKSVSQNTIEVFT
jgi:protease IV